MAMRGSFLMIRRIFRSLFSKKARKKAIFFSFLSLIILAFFMMVFSNIYASRIFKTELDVKSAKVNTANSLVVFIEDIYIPRILRTCARWATLTLIEYVDVGNNRAASDMDGLISRFENLIVNGTIDGDIATFQQDMENYTLEKWFNNISKDVESNMNLDLEFNTSAANIIVFQSNAWRVTINLTVPFRLTGDDVLWDVNKTYQVNYSIMGFKDPLYAMNNLQPQYQNVIFQTNSTAGKQGFWTSKEEFEDNLYNPGYYTRSTRGVSFLQRFINASYDPDIGLCCGIQSLVHPGVNTHHNLQKNNYSYVDHLFFNESIIPSDQLYLISDCYWPPEEDNLTERHGKFKLDFGTMVTYNITPNYCDATMATQPGDCLRADDPAVQSGCLDN